MSTRNITHVEIPARDPDESGRFYHELFGWKITPIPQANYTVWESGAGSRGGFPALADGVQAGAVSVYVDSDDIDSDLERAKALGGEIVQPKVEIPGRGWYGFFRDPAGNVIGLFTRRADR